MRLLMRILHGRVADWRTEMATDGGVGWRDPASRCLRLLALPAAGVVLLGGGCSSPSTTRTSTPAASVPSAAATVSTPASTATPAASATPTVSATGYKDATYEIEGKRVQLVSGVSEVEAAPGSASKIVTRYFGNEATGDLNGDGLMDMVFLLTQTSGGSGTFFYAVVALRTATGWTGTNAVLLGDRVAPQTTEVRGTQVLVNYAERKPEEPMTSRPSVGVTKRLSVVGGRLSE